METKHLLALLAAGACTAGEAEETGSAVDEISGVVWRGDFETGDLGQWSRVQAQNADRVRVVSSPTAQGQWAGRFTVRHGDLHSSGARAPEACRGEEPTVLATGSAPSFGLAVWPSETGYAYWTSSGDGSVRRADKHTTQSDAVASEQATPWGIAV